jgi:hypothetical protein
MQMMLSITALESLWHLMNPERPHPSHTEGWGTHRR